MISEKVLQFVYTFLFSLAIFIPFSLFSSEADNFDLKKLPKPTAESREVLEKAFEMYKKSALEHFDVNSITFAESETKEPEELEKYISDSIEEMFNEKRNKAITSGEIGKYVLFKLDFLFKQNSKLLPGSNVIPTKNKKTIIETETQITTKFSPVCAVPLEYNKIYEKAIKRKVEFDKIFTSKKYTIYNNWIVQQYQYFETHIYNTLGGEKTPLSYEQVIDPLIKKIENSLSTSSQNGASPSSHTEFDQKYSNFFSKLVNYWEKYRNAYRDTLYTIKLDEEIKNNFCTYAGLEMRISLRVDHKKTLYSAFFTTDSYPDPDVTETVFQVFITNANELGKVGAPLPNFLLLSGLDSADDLKSEFSEADKKVKRTDGKGNENIPLYVRTLVD